MSSSPVTSVSFEDFRHDLIDAGGHAQQVYLSWRARAETRPDYKDVISFVEGFAHRFLFAITEEMLEKTIKRSEHALGDLKKEEAEDRRIEDFDTPFALHYLFHMYLEETCSVPTWQEWWAWLTEGNGKKFYIAKIQAYFDWKNLPEDEKSHLRDAVQWRVGKFYYSAFRELEIFTKLRTRYHLPVKYFVLADVLLKADLWMERTVVSVYFENPRYREGETGRKQRPQYFLEPGFRFLDVTVRRQGFGRFWRVRDDDVTALAQELQAV